MSSAASSGRWAIVPPPLGDRSDDEADELLSSPSQAPPLQADGLLVDASALGPVHSDLVRSVLRSDSADAEVAAGESLTADSTDAAQRSVWSERATKSPTSGEFSRVRCTSAQQQDDEPTQPESETPTDHLASDEPFADGPFVDRPEPFFDQDEDDDEPDTIPAPPWLDDSH